ncbi:AraC family transcriptional regulator [Olivibacter sp. SDN3]|uniref:AraC family transcriptional regulator n=1 Tax=Olivibacter sp. SDN3 TaxID=2764720 RepID=UPI0016515C05|nr:helix-turn-helix domain-containing protein [Olivibacter sp. SDN3]QNL51024.1 AraC family transcriptional regulator [Olivibacter sp. SDN3]
MEPLKMVPPTSVALLVKDILIFEETDSGKETNLPFFADGYPGLLFQQTAHGLFIKPHNKLMPTSFLYGQTIRPIEMQISGAYLLVIFRLYPFVFKSFFGVDPKSINDGCYDLEAFREVDMTSFNRHLFAHGTVEAKVKAIANLLFGLLERKKQNLDFKVKQVIERIIRTNGQESIHSIASAVHVNGRTLERRFLRETGLPPKQFARIIQFNASFEQLAQKDFDKMNEVVYANGFADQSHFIRVFKAFTGKTPRVFSKRMN